MKKLTQAFNIDFVDTNANQGWAFGQAVGIATVQWPRSRANGLPMAHIWTCLVPEEYRVKGEEYVAVSLFQADDHVANLVEGVEELINTKVAKEDAQAQEFWDGLLAYANNRHSMEKYMTDIIDGGWALIWLTQAEFEGELTPLPSQEASTYPGYKSFDGTSCFKHNQEAKYLELILREDDPNVGRDLEEFAEGDDVYISMFSEKGEELGLEERFFGLNHFGGTANPVQAIPEFSPYYIEFEESLGDANMGGGNGQIDLLNDELDWACG